MEKSIARLMDSVIKKTYRPIEFILIGFDFFVSNSLLTTVVVDIEENVKVYMKKK